LINLFKIDEKDAVLGGD